MGSKVEMEAFIEKVEGGSLPANWETIYKAVDTDNGGCVNYCEFLAATLPDTVAKNEKFIHAAFRLLDVKVDNEIRGEDLEGFLGKGRHPREVLDAVIKEADVNNRGYLNFE